MRGIANVLCLDGTPRSLLVADVRALGLRGILDHGTDVDLRSTDEVVARIEQRAQHHLASLPYVEATLAPKAIRFGDETVDGAIELSLSTSTYDRFLAAVDVRADGDPDVVLAAMLRLRLGTPPELSHSLGVNLTLETADGKFLWSRRSSAAHIDGGMLAPAMNEGASTVDVDALGHWDPVRTALRGLAEELGLGPEDLAARPGRASVEPHSVIAQVGNGGISVLAHATTRLSADEVERRRAGAPDHREADGPLVRSEASMAGLRDLLVAGGAWVGWGPAALLGLASVRFGGTSLPRISVGAPDAVVARVA